MTSIVSQTLLQKPEVQAQTQTASAGKKEYASVFGSVLEANQKARDTAEKPETKTMTSQQENGTLQGNAFGGDLPLEAFTLPDWYCDYMPEEASISLEIDYEYWELTGSLTRDGGLDDGDRAILRNYLDNSASHQKYLEHDRFRRQYQEELSEYSKILDGYMKESLDKRGIHGPRDYYESIVLNKVVSEEVHQEVHGQLMGDPRAVELMDVLGVEV